MKIGLGSLIVYFGVGFLIHLISIGSTIDWASAFSMFVILLWPFYLLYLAGIVVIWVVIIIVVVIASWMIVEKLKG